MRGTPRMTPRGNLTPRMTPRGTLTPRFLPTPRPNAMPPLTPRNAPGPGTLPPQVVTLMRKMVARKATIHRLMDADKNDMITAGEFANGVAMSGIRPVPTEEEMETLFAQFDAASDGRLSYGEVMDKLTAFQKQILITAPKIRRAPKAQPRMVHPDAPVLREIREAVARAGSTAAATQACGEVLHRISNGTGCVRWRIFRGALKALGLQLSQREFIHVCRKYDPNGLDQVHFHDALHDLQAMLQAPGPL